jgi:hypothetical protein
MSTNAAGLRRLAGAGGGSRFALILMALPLLLASCTPRLGWGVLLWSAPASGLHAGAIVPVYIRSNIEKLYVVGVPGGRTKIEVPLWQLELFKSKGAAEKRLADFGSFVTSYLFANRDGLPIRDSATNLGKRVYRLREGQSVKILAEVKGDVVSSGTTPLEGSWYNVLTEDGTRGYVFSNTMRLYDELVEAPPSVADDSSKDPAHRVDLVFSRVWRAEYFQAMIDEGRVDLDLVSPRFGFFADSVRRQIRIELPAVSQVFNYSSIAQSGEDIVFEGTALRVRLDGDRKLVADWSGASSVASTAPVFSDSSQPSVVAAAPSPMPAIPGTSGPTNTGPAPAAPAAGPGKTVPAAPAGSAQLPSGAAAALGQPSGTTNGASPAVLPPSPENAAAVPPPASATQATFVVLTTELRDAIRAEETRRLNLLSAFVDSGAAWTFLPPAGTTGAIQPGGLTPAQPSPNSRLVVSRGGRFSWTGIDLVPPAYLPADLGVVEENRASGEATVRLGLGPTLSGLWEGVFSIRFDGTRAWLDLLYRHEGKTLVLLPVAPGSVRNLSADSASALSPLVFAASN